MRLQKLVRKRTIEGYEGLKGARYDSQRVNVYGDRQTLSHPAARFMDLDLFLQERGR